MMVAFYRSKSLVQTRLNTFQRNCRCLIAVPDQLSPEDPADVTVIPGSVAFVTKKTANRHDYAALKREGARNGATGWNAQCRALLWGV
ncbi:unnamed protein product [Peronospora destructor]|uniref:Uncharacterized protein n=1 Tax=Peronospora destructor TaxID=86335 RepID=A0AAV0U2S5_9STRA|nr:unnamed protein product [Peronospora destructor]